MCNKNVRVIKNSGPCNPMMDRLISSVYERSCSVSLNMKYFENLKKYALGPFSLPRPQGIFHCACVTLNSTFSVTFIVRER